MRSLLFGAAGQLGRELLALLGDTCAWAGDVLQLDVRDAAAVRRLVSDERPDVVWNATAWNRVDAAEGEPEAAFAVNALAPRAMALAARDAGALFVHFSTDYVFDGRASRPYREDDAARPLSVYGASKLAGELLVAASGARHLIVRTSGVLGRGGSEQKGGSFLDRIVAQARAGKPLRVVTDQEFAPTVAADLAAAALALVRADARGCFHVTNAGTCTWRDLARAALTFSGIEAEVEPICAADLRLPAVRPRYSVLDCSRYASLGLPPLPHWRERLALCTTPR